MNKITITAIGAYWGDGTKSLSGCLEFTNSEPALIKIFMKMMKNLFSIKPNELSYKIKIHENSLRNRSVENVIKRWTNNIGIKSNKIKVYVVKNRKKTNLHTRTPEKFGSMQIRCFKSNYHHKLLKIMNESIRKAFWNKEIAVPLIKGLLAADGYVHPSRIGRIQEITIAEKSRKEKEKIRKVLKCIGISSATKEGHGSAVVIYGYNNFKIFKSLNLFSLSPRKMKKFLLLYSHH